MLRRFLIIIAAWAMMAHPASAWTMTAVGDIMLDRYVETLLNRNGVNYPFQTIQSQLTGNVVLANLEGPFTSSPSVATDNHLVFTFDPKFAPALKSNGFTVLSLANNHTLNFGEAGLRATRTTLKQANLDYFGDPKNRTNFHLTKNINGRAVTFLGYHGLSAGLDTVLLDAQIAKAKKEVVIVMAHEGTEYNLGFTAKQQSDYHRLIDAGADMVIGAHPHVVEPLEVYKGKLIAYSLGNFIFDQYFSVATQQGLMLKFNLTSIQTAIQFIPLDLTKSQPKMMIGNQRQALLDRLANSSIVAASQRSDIRNGILTLPAL